MGSDDTGREKSMAHRLMRTTWLYHRAAFWMMRKPQTNIIILSFSALIVWVIAMKGRLLPAPELVLGNHFSSSLYYSLPPQCKFMAQRFHHCQATATETVVFACHRKWCNSTAPGDHCVPWTWTGDHLHLLLSSIQVVFDKGIQENHCIRVQLDMPMQDTAILDTAVFKDPSGWWGEFGRYRSYTGSTPKEPLASSVIVSHFSQNDAKTYAYDPCLFYLLFQPVASLQKEIEIYNTRIDSFGPSIGIYFQAADVASFAISNDTGTHVKDLESAWKMMLDCADHLAQSLYPDFPLPYFLATDSRDLKEIVQKQQQNASAEHLVFTTPIQPTPYQLSLLGGGNTLVDLHVLATSKALVTNVRPDIGLTGFAKWVGLIPHSHVTECAQN